jgi:hypothetical protein
MSTWLQLLNEVKSRSSEGYLTGSQRDTCRNLVYQLKIPGKIINLYGPHGCGKTVVAWVVASLTGAIYLPQPKAFRSISSVGPRIFLVDHAAGDEMDIRRILADASLQNAEALLVISNSPSLSKMEGVPLSAPTTEDIQIVINHYARWGYFAHGQLQEKSNFWQVMQAYVGGK